MGTVPAVTAVPRRLIALLATVALALGLADHAYLLETGRVVLAGPADEIRRNDAVRRAYLGY